MIVSTFFKIIEVGLIGGESSLFWSGVNVGQLRTNDVFRQGNVLGGSVEDFFLIRGEIYIDTVLRKKILHEIGKLVEGGLVHLLKLFLPLRKKKRETNSGVVNIPRRIEVLSIKKMGRNNSVILSENRENLITFRRPEKSGLLVRMSRKIGQLSEVSTTKEIVV